MSDHSALFLRQLEQFYQGESNFEALKDLLLKDASQSQAVRSELEGVILQEQREGRLSSSITQILLASLSAPSSPADLPTQLSPHVSAVTDHLDDTDSTVLTKRPEDDAATLMANVPPIADSDQERSQPEPIRQRAQGLAPVELTPGCVLKDQFVIESTLGAGGMGMVFKARDLLMEEMKDRDPYVAIKVLRPEYQGDQTLLISLQREFRKAQKLSHPNIVGMMDFTRDQATGAVFITMQYLKGDTLGELIQKKFPNGMPLDKAIPIIRGMAAALSYAHRQNIIHLDFKPGNVFVCENGDVKVLDFGIAGMGDAKTPEQEKTVFNALDLGALTPSYASLEMIEHHAGSKESYRPDPRDDIYALGCVVYEILTGRHPFGRASAKDASRSGLSAKEPPGLGKRRWLQLRRSLAYKQSERLESVDALLKAFEPFSLASPKSVATLLITSALAVAGFQWFQAPPVECQSPVISDADALKIKDLLEVAAVDMDVGYLTAPPASNALLAYQEVLKLDPCNLDATSGLGKIAATQEQEAWAAFEGGDTTLALDKVVDGLKANPRHEGLLALKSKLSNRTGN